MRCGSRGRSLRGRPGRRSACGCGQLGDCRGEAGLDVRLGLLVEGIDAVGGRVFVRDDGVLAASEIDRPLTGDAGVRHGWPPTDTPLTGVASAGQAGRNAATPGYGDTSS